MESIEEKGNNSIYSQEVIDYINSIMIPEEDIIDFSFLDDLIED